MSILSSEDPSYSALTEDAECSARQIIRHVCAGLKHYFEAHLHIKAQQIRRAKMRDSGISISSTLANTNIFTVPGYKVRYFKNNIELIFLYTFFFSVH